MNQRKTSARYYLFEEVVEETPGFAQLRHPRPLAELQLLAGLVWARERGKGACPVVRTAPPRRKFSQYNFDDKVVELARKHMDAGALLHEIAHALGVNDKLTHGPAFRRRCIHLYKLYGDWNGEIDW
jgi:hypothetical protein